MAMLYFLIMSRNVLYYYKKCTRYLQGRELVRTSCENIIFFKNMLWKRHHLQQCDVMISCRHLRKARDVTRQNSVNTKKSTNYTDLIYVCRMQ